MHARNILVRNDRGIGPSVISFTQHNAVIGWLTIEGMDEIKESIIRDAFEQGMFVSLPDLVPTYLWYDQII